MELNLQRPIAFLDLETTGTNFVKDRIVEIAILKVFPDKREETKRYLVNPEMHIPQASTAIHGICDDDVKNAPTFKQIASEILDFLNDSDLAGYNSNRFDIPLLVEEFLRLDLNFRLEDRKFIDVQNVFHKMEKRTLSAAYQFYCNKELVNAHSALEDTVASYDVLKAQLDRYPELINNVDYLSEFTTDENIVDTGRRIVIENNKHVFNFGKYKGQPVHEVLKKDPGYYNWILNNEFALHTKQKLKEIKASFSN